MQTKRGRLCPREDRVCECDLRHLLAALHFQFPKSLHGSSALVPGDEALSRVATSRRRIDTVVRASKLRRHLEARKGTPLEEPRPPLTTHSLAIPLLPLLCHPPDF